MAGMSSEALGGITSGTASCAWAPVAPAKVAASTAAASPERRWHRRERIMTLAFLVLSDPRFQSHYPRDTAEECGKSQANHRYDSATGQQLGGSEGCTEFRGRKR